LFRTYVIAVAFAIIAAHQGEKFVVPRAGIRSFMGQAVSTFFVSVAYLGSVQFIPVGLAVIIFFLFPVLIMLLAPVVEGRNPGMIRILVAILAFCGLAVAVGPSFEGLDLRGILLAGVASAAAAFQFFSGRALSRHMSPAAFGSLAHLAILPPILAIALLTGQGSLRIFPGGPATAQGLLFLSGLGAVYVAAYMKHMLSLRFAPASGVAPYFNLEPVVTTAIAATVLGERLQINQYAGGGLVLVALVASSMLGKWKE
jgi:drug/metabolite transporter (DMT)-like permease